MTSCGKKDLMYGIGGVAVGALGLFLLKKMGVMAGLGVLRKTRSPKLMPRSYR